VDHPFSRVASHRRLGGNHRANGPGSALGICDDCGRTACKSICSWRRADLDGSRASAVLEPILAEAGGANLAPPGTVFPCRTPPGEPRVSSANGMNSADSESGQRRIDLVEFLSGGVRFRSSCRAPLHWRDQSARSRSKESKNRLRSLPDARSYAGVRSTSHLRPHPVGSRSFATLAATRTRLQRATG
jgi:hypothetical protein